MRILFSSALFILIFPAATASVYQWSAPVPVSASVAATAPAKAADTLTPVAYLWIPPDCHRVRAVVIGQHNMIEEGILDDAGFRRTLTELGFAAIWITPSADYVFRFDHDAVGRFDALLKNLGELSGYSELAQAPVVPIGHSAHASYPWNFAAAQPGRTLAILSVKGDAPLSRLTGSGKSNPDWGDRTIDGVPGLMVMGQFEWSHDRLAPAEAYRAAHPGTPLAVLCDVGHGHFDYNEPLIGQLGLFLRKAALARLPADAPLNTPIALKAVDPRHGWLVDQWHPDGPRRAPAAPYGDYTGDRATAFWAFDEEHARAIEAYNDQRGRKPQLLGYRAEDGNFIEQTKSHQQVTIPFRPEADGISFRLEAGFLDSVPDGNPSKWSDLPAGSPITHSTGGGPVVISRISGPFSVTGAGSFVVDFYRGAEATSTRSSHDLWFKATHAGDATHVSAVQQALLRIPVRHREGAPQTITFPEIADQSATMSRINLGATSSSGLPVRYYVRSGSALVEGSTLVFTALPPRTRYPAEVTVIAWQYGHSAEPRVQTAEPVVRTFRLTD